MFTIHWCAWAIACECVSQMWRLSIVSIVFYYFWCHKNVNRFSIDRPGHTLLCLLLPAFYTSIYVWLRSLLLCANHLMNTFGKSICAERRMDVTQCFWFLWFCFGFSDTQNYRKCLTNVCRHRRIQFRLSRSRVPLPKETEMYTRLHSHINSITEILKCKRFGSLDGAQLSRSRINMTLWYDHWKIPIPLSVYLHNLNIVKCHNCVAKHEILRISKFPTILIGDRYWMLNAIALILLHTNSGHFYRPHVAHHEGDRLLCIEHHFRFRAHNCAYLSTTRTHTHRHVAKHRRRKKKYGEHAQIPYSMQND